MLAFKNEFKNSDPDQYVNITKIVISIFINFITYLQSSVHAEDSGDSKGT